MTLLLFGTIGLTEILIIVVVAALLLGGKKIPELMTGVAKGIKSFKKEIREDNAEDPAKE